jgi:hypothetical protein
MIDLATNVLHDGSNLDILRRYLPGATDAQLLTFEDTRHSRWIAPGRKHVSA